MVPLDIRVHEVGSVPDLLQKVAEQFTGNHAVLFRGHRDESWTLSPRVARTRFRLRYSASLLDAECQMLDEFERLAVPYIGGRSISSPWDKLALAQHHGLPTRLLDWSSNPLVALWFAIEKPSIGDADAAIWAYEVDKDDIAPLDSSPFEQSRTMVFRPRHHDARIVAQAGWFTVHKYLGHTEQFSTLERIKAHRPELQKFVIPSRFFASLREDVARCGIHQSSLFPDLAGLCNHLLWQFSPQDDEIHYDAVISL